MAAVTPDGSFALVATGGLVEGAWDAAADAAGAGADAILALA
jgi:hypothetical protein